MSLLERLGSDAEWQEFLLYKTEKHHLTKRSEKELRGFIEGKEYLPAARRILAGEGLSAPEKKLIRKTGTAKKRTVYLFPREENYVLKLLTFLLLREYDGIFSDDLYSFRVSSGACRAINNVLHAPGIDRKYTYKADISNYFNSIDVERLLGKLDVIFAGDEPLLDFFRTVLRDKRVIDRGGEIFEDKGVMAGVPFAVFLANVYLMDLDSEAERKGLLYARYSDDIILFADSAEERDEAADSVRDYISSAGLEINADKEFLTSPGESWSFLGIKYCGGVIDISDVSLAKLKAKIRRRARALKRWQARKNASPEQAVKAFIRAMNRKLFSPDTESELTWSRWYFPVINTDSSLHEIELYIQQWIRFLAAGRHSKAGYSFRYEKMKKLGYISLVHAWYEYRAEEKADI